MTVRLMKESEPWGMTADAAACRVGYAGRSELALRHALEAFCRERWSGARLVHELVMGEGKVRADVVAIEPAHLVAFEIKGAYDNTVRLLHQVGMFQLCMPEVWMVVDDKHCDDAKMIRHLMPSVGLLAAPTLGYARHRRQSIDEIELTVVAEPQPRPIVPEMTLRVLWAAELRICCDEAGVPATTRASRATLVKRLLAVLDGDGIIKAACARLRARDALWRADDPI